MLRLIYVRTITTEHLCAASLSHYLVIVRGYQIWTRRQNYQKCVSPLLVNLSIPSTPSGSWIDRVFGSEPPDAVLSPQKKPITDKSLRLSLSRVSERDTNSVERRDERQQRKVIPHRMLDKAPDVPDKSQSKHTDSDQNWGRREWNILYGTES